VRKPKGGFVINLPRLLHAQFCGERLPAIHLAHVDLTGGKQRPEQHRGGIGRRQHGLRLDPSFELFVQPLDGICGPHAAPLAWRQPRKGEQAFAGFLQAIGDGPMLKPKFSLKNCTRD